MAHIDHGWRIESGYEAEMLIKLAERLKLPLHLHILEKVCGSNLENKCREKRLVVDFCIATFSLFTYDSLHFDFQ